MLNHTALATKCIEYLFRIQNMLNRYPIKHFGVYCLRIATTKKKNNKKTTKN